MPNPLYFKRYAVWLLLLLPPLLSASENTISLHPDEPKTFVGSQMGLSIIVTGLNVQTPPTLPEVKGLKAVSLDCITNPHLDTLIHTYRYMVTGIAKGDLFIPPITVTVDGRKLTSKPLKLTFLNAGVSDKLSLTTTLSKHACYVGEPILLTTTFTSKYPLSTIKAVNMHLPALSHPEFKVHQKSVGVKRRREIGLPVNNTRVIAGLKETTVDNSPLYTLVFHHVIQPKTRGVHSLKPARLFCSVAKAQPPRPTNRKSRRHWTQYPSYFNNEFFQNAANASKYHQFKCQGKELTITVKPLPNAGRPPNFSGIVNAFDLTTSIVPTETKVGSPMTLTVTIDNHPFMEVVMLPTLARLPELSRNFMIPDKQAAGFLKGSTRQLSQTLRPTSVKVREIPALRIPYFDAASGKYAYAVSKPISITVKPNPTFSEYDADFTDGSIAKNEVEESETGIYFNYLPEDEGRLSGFIYAPLTFWGILLLPWCIFLGTLAKRRFLPADRRTTSTYRKRAALKRLVNAATDDAPIVANAVREYFGAHTGVSAESVTLIDVERALNQHPDLHAEFKTIAGFLFEQDKRSYSETPSTDDDSATTKGIANTMRTIGKFLGMLILAVTLNTTAADVDGKSLFERGLAQQATDLRQARDDFDQAAARFEAEASNAPDHSVSRGKLLYNAGNAHFLGGELGRAILCYQRARRIIPYDRQLMRNLEVARTHCIDDVPSPPHVKWIRDLLFWHYRSSYACTFWAFVLTYAGFWITYLRSRRDGGKKGPVVILLLMSLAVTASMMVKRLDLQTDIGVVTAAEVIPYKGPDYAYEPAITSALHSGTEFTIIGQSKGWVHLKLGNHMHCWLPEDTIDLVKP